MQRVALHRGGEHIRSRCGLQQDVSGSMCAIGSSGIMMRVVQGRTNGHDSSSCGPTDELRSKYVGCSAPTERGVVDSDVQRSPKCAMQQCSGWFLCGKRARGAVSGSIGTVQK